MGMLQQVFGWLDVLLQQARIRKETDTRIWQPHRAPSPDPSPFFLGHRPRFGLCPQSLFVHQKYIPMDETFLCTPMGKSGSVPVLSNIKTVIGYELKRQLHAWVECQVFYWLWCSSAKVFVSLCSYSTCWSLCNSEQIKRENFKNINEEIKM